MKREMYKLISTCAIAILFLGAFAGLPLVKASPAPIVYIDPPNYIWNTNTVPPKFNVTVWVKDPAASFNLMMFQVYIMYDHRYINVTQVWGEVTGGWTYRAWPNDNFDGRNWDDQYVFKGKTGGSIGNPYYYNLAPNLAAIKIGDVIGAQMSVPANTPYKLACFEFAVTAIPPKGGYLESVLNINNPDTYLYDAVGQIPGVTIQDGYYRLDWAVPPPAHFDIERADGQPWPLVFEKWWPAVGKTFKTKVYIEDLAEAWGIVGANFTLNYDSTLISTSAADVVIDSLWSGPNTIDDSVPGALFIEVLNPPAVTGGKVLVATITFTVIYQGTYPDVDETDIWFDPYYMWDHERLIETTTPGKGHVKIEGFLAIPLAYFEVYQPDPTIQGANTNDTVLGPEPSIGREFEIHVKINNMYAEWFMIAWQVRFYYDPILIQFIEGEEGPFLKDPRWNLYGTYFACNEFPFPPTHVAVGAILFPNPETGEYDQTEFPNTVYPPIADNTLAILRFRAIKQLWPENLTCVLGLSGLSEWLVDKDGNYIPVAEDKVIEGTYTMLGTPVPGRAIDVYGGAVNRGYGSTPFPEPYGGQGPNNDMDLVVPQSVVYLFAYVTYNFWPVQSKDVGFEIDGPFLQEGWNRNDPQTWEPRETYHIRKYSNRTSTGDCDNPGGVAWIKFQMPWPCDNPEDYFGKYRVTVTVDICGVVVSDVLWFDYYYLLEITKVTTDKYSYEHCEDVVVTVEYKTKAQQRYPVLFAIVLQDELETHVSAAYKELLVGGAKFCTWKTDSFNVTLHIEKWAFAGYAHIYVSAFDKDPTFGGAPWCPTFGLGWPPDSELPKIYIQPV